MTSLANQLKSLALPHTQAVLGDERKRVSLLFDPTEAANLDKEAIFAIGIGGLEELIEIDSVFIEYQKSLFNESASGLQRLVQTKDVNRQLDETIKLFLVNLSPYFLLRPAHKALEWLIYRYQINFYNIDDLLVCILPYHDSNIFTRVIQILNLSSTTSKWHWLEAVQKHGTQLPYQTIATHAYKDEGFLNFISSIPEQFINVHGYEKSGSNSPVHSAMAFYTKIVLNSIQIQSDTLKNSFLAQLTTFLLKGLKSRNDEYKCSSYMILGAICSKVTLDQRFIESVLPLLTKRMTIRNGFEALSCLILVFKTQPSISSLPKRCFKHLCRLPGVVQHLAQLHEWGVLNTFWPHLLRHLVPAAIKDCRLGVTSSSDGGGAGGELLAGKPEYWSLLESLLSDCTLRDENACLVIKLMCDGYVANKQVCHTEESQVLLAERMKAMLRLMEQKYRAIVDAEIRKQMESSNDNELIQEFALMSISSFKYKGSDWGINLTLSLNHPASTMRLHGVKELSKLLKNETDSAIDDEFVSNALYSRLLDDDKDVATAVTSIDDKYLRKYLTVSQLIGVIKASATKGVVSSCCKLLSKYKDGVTTCYEITRLVIFYTHQKEKDLVAMLTRTLKQLPLLQGFVFKESGWEDLIIETVATNVAQHENPIEQIKLLLHDDSPYLRHIVSRILIMICTSNLVTVSVKLSALTTLLELSTAISEQMKGSEHVTCAQSCLDSALFGITEILHGWSDGWFSCKDVTNIYQAFLTKLISERAVVRIAAVLQHWMDANEFDQSFVTMSSRLDNFLTVNLIYLVNEMPDERLRKLSLTSHGNKTLGCLISLLMNEEKLIRKAAMKMLSHLHDLSGGYWLQSVTKAVLSQAQEIRTDSLHTVQVISSVFEEGTNSDALRGLLSWICDVVTPAPMARALLDSLKYYTNPSVLVGIEAVLSRLLSDVSDNVDAGLLRSCLSRYDERSAKILVKKTELWNLFLKAINLPSCQHHALFMVTHSFFDALQSEQLQQALLLACIDIYLQSDDAKTHAAVSKLVRRVTLPAEIVKAVLESVVGTQNQDQSMKTKKMRRSQAVAERGGLDTIEWRRVRLLLEWLQNKKKIEGISLLVTPVFRLISQVLEMEAGTGTDYMKHLLLGCMDNILGKLSAADQDSKEELPVDQLNMESIVQCIRTSKNPQTHQQALLVLRTTAKLYPDVVLHHVMSIFTYMGANIMRQDDMYSFQIITKTLDTVVPEIIKSSDGSGEFTITGIIRVFVDAYPHIPEHRRLPLFTKLLDTVGEYKYLYVCACLCVEALTTSAIVSETLNDSEWKSESNQLMFLMSLFAKFPLLSQLEACTRLLEFHCTLPAEAEQTRTKVSDRSSRKDQRKATLGFFLEKTKNVIADGLFDTTIHTDKQLRHFKYECAGFVVSLLASSTFIEQAVNTGEDTDLTSNYNQLVEVGLRYINLVATETNKHASHPTAKFWRALLHKAYEILDKVNALLPGRVFIDVISSLLSNDLPLIRRKAMDLLNNRLPQTVFNNEEMASLVGLISMIKAIAFDQSTTSEDTEDTTNRQTALYSLKIMTRLLANVDIKPFLELLPEACSAFGNIQLTAIRANILLLMGELMSQLKIAAVPYLPKVLPKLVSVLQQEALLKSNHLLWISAVTALQKIVETIPNFLSQYALDILVIVAGQSSVVTSGGDLYKGYKSQLPVRLKSLRECLSKEFSSRILVPVLIKAYTSICTQKKSVECLMGIVADHIDHMSKDDLSTHHHKLLDLFLLVLDYRATNYREDPSSIEEMENATIKATLKMIIKLSEASFRPMYFKLYAWATRESEISDRLITFYRLSNQIADTLRGLFSLFASHIVKNASDALNSANCSKSEVSSMFNTDPNEETKNTLLCISILDCLHKCFLYDTEGFVTKQRFNILMQSLVDQLENEVEGYQRYVKNHVVPCISQLAIAVGDDSLWKPLIYQICLKTRHSSAEVRKGSLYVLRNLNSKLGEDFMPLLPETIPFLAELMEDDEEEVEALCQEVIADMETVLGEPLQKYF